MYRRSGNNLRVCDDVHRRAPRLPTPMQRRLEVPAILAVAARRWFAAVHGEGGRLANEFNEEDDDAQKYLQFSRRSRLIIIIIMIIIIIITVIIVIIIIIIMIIIISSTILTNADSVQLNKSGACVPGLHHHDVGQGIAPLRNSNRWTVTQRRSLREMQSNRQVEPATCTRRPQPSEIILQCTEYNADALLFPMFRR